MRNAYVVIKDMVDLIPENEEERFQRLKHNFTAHILGSWAHAAPEKQYSMHFWDKASFYLNECQITDDEMKDKEWIKQMAAIFFDPNYKIDESNYKMFIKT